MKENNCPIEDNKAYLAGRAHGAESAVSIADAGASLPLNSTLQEASYVVSKSPLRVRCCAGSNSHKLKARCWRGENPADEHDLDHIDKPKLLVHQGLET